MTPPRPCVYCQGRGGFRGPDGRWRQCRCKRPSRTEIRAQQSTQLTLLKLDPEQQERLIRGNLAGIFRSYGKEYAEAYIRRHYGEMAEDLIKRYYAGTEGAGENG